MLPVLASFLELLWSIFPQPHICYTGCLQMNGAVSKVNKKFISHLTRAKRTPLATATVQVSHALPAVRSLVLTAVLRGQFPRWHHAWCVFYKPRTALHAALQSQIWTPQNGAHRKPFPAAAPSCKLTPRPCSKHEKRTAGSA